MLLLKQTAGLILLLSFSALLKAECTDLINHQMQKLHSSKQIDLCKLLQGKAVLVVNTASYCGFTGQFRGLEDLYNKFRSRGFEVVGVPSNSFNQEAAAESETANICYKNYGVSFTMTTKYPVKGSSAHPMFMELANQTGSAPKWNFHKYLINREGVAVAQFPSQTAPNSPEFIQAIETLL